MQQVSITAIRRASRFSPNSVEQDAAIMGAVCRQLQMNGCIIHEYDEDEVNSLDTSQVFLTMGRSTRLLDLLSVFERDEAIVINSTAGIRLCCHRSKLEMTLRQAKVTLPEDGQKSEACWLKRGDAPAQTADDVIFVTNTDELERKKQQFLQRGISDIIVSPHVEGDLIKFYGVAGTSFFRIFYPGDDLHSKFGNELHNGRPQHYKYSIDKLHSMAELAAQAVGIIIYGGDAVVRRDGSFCMIDFNDWPSFSRCREEAALAIACRIKELIVKR